VLSKGTRIGDYVVMGTVGGPGRWRITYSTEDPVSGEFRLLEEFHPQEFVRREGVRLVPRSDEAKSALRWGLIAFVNEARILQRQRHPALARVHDVIEENGTAYYVTERISDKSLADLLKTTRSWPASHTQSLLLHVLAALEVSAPEGFMHRDITPRRIRFRGEQPVLCGFSGGRNAMRFKARSIADALSPGYAPLESYSVNGKQGPWTDIYGLAAVAWRCLTGKEPPDALQRAGGIEMERLKIEGPESTFFRAIEWGLALDPARRPQTPSEWRHAILGQKPIPDYEGGAISVSVPAESASPEAPSQQTTAPTPPPRPAAPAPAAEPPPRSEPRLAAPQPAPTRTWPPPPEPEPEPAGRSMALPLIGALIVIAAAAGGGWYYMQGSTRPVPTDQEAQLTADEEAADSAAMAAQDGGDDAAAADTASPAGTADASTADSSSASGGFKIDQKANDDASLAFEKAALAMIRAESSHQQTPTQQQQQQAAAAAAAEAQRQADAAAAAAAQRQAQLQAQEAALEKAKVQAAQAASQEQAAKMAEMQKELDRLRKEADDRAKADATAKAEAERKATQAKNSEANQQLALKKEIADARKRCRIAAADLTDDGLLTYERAKLLKGSRIVDNTVHLPPVSLPDGQTAVFAITPDDCAQIIRTSD